MAARDVSNFPTAVPLNIVKASVTVDGRGIVAPLQQAEVSQRRWIPDERDAFIGWLRGEFAAANAIIDAMCQHLQMTGRAGEYDFVLACIQQRRYNWTAVLHMQHYFSVAEVVFALQQVALRKQQENNSDSLLLKQHYGSVEGDVRSSSKVTSQIGVTFHKDQRQESVYSGNNGIAHFAGGENQSRRDSSEESPNENVRRAGEKRENKKPTGALTSDGASTRVPTTEARTRQITANHNNGNARRGTENGLPPAYDRPLQDVDNMDGNRDPVQATQKISHQNAPTSDLADCGGSNADNVSKVFPKGDDIEELGTLKVSRNLSCFEEIEGKMVNVIEGLELYENVVDKREAETLVALVNTPQVTGRMGTNRGHAFISSKRLPKGKAKEPIQFGTVPTEVLEGHNSLPFILKEESADPMPAALEMVIDRLVSWKIFSANKRPDTCIIQTSEEGFVTLPSHNHNFEEPFCILPVLSESSLSILNKIQRTTSFSDVKEGLTLTLSVGSVLVLQGKSADLAKYAVFAASPKQIFFTFGKMLDKPSIVKGIENGGSVLPDPVKVAGNSKTLETPTKPGSKHIPIPGHGPSPKGNHLSVKVKSVSSMPGVLPVPPARSTGPIHHTISSPSVPPVFPSNNGNPGAYSAVALMAPGWSTVPAIRLPSAGTGVFLPFIGGPNGNSQSTNGTQRQQGIITSMPLVQIVNHVVVPGSQSGSATTSTATKYSKSSTPVLVFDQESSQFLGRTELSMSKTHQAPDSLTMLTAPGQTYTKEQLTGFDMRHSNGTS